MTDTIFVLCCQLSSCHSNLGYQKNRIIAKPTFAAWSIGDYTLDHALHQTSIARRFSYCNYTTETSRALLNRKSFQSLENQTKTLLIGCILTRKTGREHARSSTKCIYFQAGI